jgi:hypothetical protein
VIADGTTYDITTPVDGEDTHAVNSFEAGRKWMYWRVCDQVDVPRERVTSGEFDEVTCEACQGAWG